MKHLAVLLALALPAQAQAEIFTLHQEGAWTVNFRAATDDLDHPWCEALVLDQESHFQIIAWDSGNLSLAIFDQATTWNPEGKLTIRIDSRDPWEAIGTSVGSTFFVDNPKRQFLEEVYLGRVIYVDINRDWIWDYQFPLDGSAAAIKALADCKDKLGAHPA